MVNLKKMSGFTLIEIMMVILIVAILASLAMPQYTKVVEKAKMTEARLTLSAIRVAEGVYYSENDQYTTDTLNLDVDQNSLTKGNYEYSIELDDSKTDSEGIPIPGFNVTATRKGGKFAGCTLVMTAEGNVTGTGEYEQLLGKKAQE